MWLAVVYHIICGLRKMQEFMIASEIKTAEGIVKVVSKDVKFRLWDIILNKVLCSNWGIPHSIPQDSMTWNVMVVVSPGIYLMGCSVV